MAVPPLSKSTTTPIPTCPSKRNNQTLNMNSVQIAPPLEYNRCYGGDGAGQSGILTTFGAAKNAIDCRINDDYDEEIDLCSEIVDSQSQGHSKWKIYKKPKLRKKSRVECDLVKQEDNSNLADGYNGR